MIGKREQIGVVVQDSNVRLSSFLERLVLWRSGFDMSLRIEMAGLVVFRYR